MPVHRGGKLNMERLTWYDIQRQEEDNGEEAINLLLQKKRFFYMG